MSAPGGAVGDRSGGPCGDLAAAVEAELGEDVLELVFPRCARRRAAGRRSRRSPRPGPAHDEVACPWPQPRVCDRRAVGVAEQGGRPCAQVEHDERHEAGRLPCLPGRELVVQRSGPVQVAVAGDGSEYEVAPDGWALKTVAITRAAHAEHTVAITLDGPRILTVP